MGLYLNGWEAALQAEGYEFKSRQLHFNRNINGKSKTKYIHILEFEAFYEKLKENVGNIYKIKISIYNKIAIYIN